MRRDIDLRRAVDFGVLPVALRAELSSGGFGRFDRAWRDLMLLRCHVTRRALQQRMG